MPGTALMSIVAKKTVNKDSHFHGVFSTNMRDDTVAPITTPYGRV